MIALPALVLLIAADQRGWLLYDPGTDLPISPARQNAADMAAYHHQTVRVVRVLDGDTLEVDVPDGDRPVTRVRLRGVDAPETRRTTPDGQVVPADPWAEEAQTLAETLVGGRHVRLTLDEHQTRGFYGRLLGYVELPDKSWLGEHLLSAGFARADPRWPHERSSRYELLQLEAQRSRRGIWSE